MVPGLINRCLNCGVPLHFCKALRITWQSSPHTNPGGFQESPSRVANKLACSVAARSTCSILFSLRGVPKSPAKGRGSLCLPCPLRNCAAGTHMKENTRNPRDVHYGLLRVDHSQHFSHGQTSRVKKESPVIPSLLLTSL